MSDNIIIRLNMQQHSFNADGAKTIFNISMYLECVNRDKFLDKQQLALPSCSNLE